MTRYYLYSAIAKRIIKAIGNEEKWIALSLDLNLSEKKWPISDEKLILDTDSTLTTQVLEPVVKSKNKIYLLENNTLLPIEKRTDCYYKLVPGETAPTLEINGIKMHRSKDIDPLIDAKLKTRLVVSKDDYVLDTCGGLGYSAIFALKAGAGKVLSCEKSRSVIQIRNLNPWYAQSADSRLKLIHADITSEIDTCDSNTFNSVIHDPPRFTSSTGDLYGKKFYTQLYTVMAPGSKLFHYTGSPKKIKTKDKFVKNTIRRLGECGFNSIRFNERLQGIYAEKN